MCGFRSYPGGEAITAVLVPNPHHQPALSFRLPYALAHCFPSTLLLCEQVSSAGNAPIALQLSKASGSFLACSGSHWPPPPLLAGGLVLFCVMSQLHGFLLQLTLPSCTTHEQLQWPLTRACN